MPNLENLTRVGASDLVSIDPRANELLVVCVSARFVLPGADAPPSFEPSLADAQPPPPLEDLYGGDPATSSLLAEGQTAYGRPGTDVTLTGSARAPGGEPTDTVDVEVAVGPCRKRARVTGDRHWDRGLFGARISDPEPFVSMPLVYERAFGGRAAPDDEPMPDDAPEKPVAWEPRNPVGCGLYANARAAAGRPVPNVEDPSAPITRLRDRPTPWGFGPIARHWQPRLGWAGTYDEAWVAERAPLWPRDFDERFFCAASPGLTTPQPLRGGEPVLLAGVSPDGPIRFSLPRRRFVARARFRHGEARRALVLDAVHLEPDAGVFTMFWRTAFPTAGRLAGHVRSSVRELEPWEADPDG